MKLTKAMVDKQFLEDVMPYIRMIEKEYRVGRYTKDIPMRCQDYNDFIDMLNKDGLLTDYQANTYCIPNYLI